MAKDIPPYSWTRVRTLNPKGVTSWTRPSGTRRTRTIRPPSSGRPSSQHTPPPAGLQVIRGTPPPATMSGEIGERQAPYGATIGMAP